MGFLDISLADPSTFLVWSHVSARLQDFLHHFNSLRSTLQFSMQVQNNSILFLDILVTKRGFILSTKLYTTPTHTGRYLYFKSDHLKNVKRGNVYSLFNTAKIICQERKDFEKEIKTIRQDLTHNRYLQHFINYIIESGKNKPHSSDRIPHDSIVISYIIGKSERSRSTDYRFNIRIIFETKCTLRGALLTTRPERDIQQRRQCVYSIPCDCGKCYTGQTGRPLEFRIKNHKHNLKKCKLEKSKLAQQT